jgi:hypothetical protein
MKNSGLKWGMFTLRLPLLHMRIEWSLLLQGLVVSLSTALALVPLLTTYFGLSFDEAVTMAMLLMMLVTSHIVVFGEPFAAGWITPALPLVLTLIIGGLETPSERFQMMTALSLEFSVLTFLLAITKLGKKLVDMVPPVLTAGIILAAALSAFKRIFHDDADIYASMPFSFTISIIVCFVIFYLPIFQRFRLRNKMANKIATYGLLPAFLIAGLVGFLKGELIFDIQWGLLLPPIEQLLGKVSPFSIGFPPMDYYIAAAPIVLMTYLILFGDLLTGKSIIEESQEHRLDDPIDIDLNRSHYAVSIRNFLMGLIVPFFPTQGVLWAGAQIIAAQNWKEGKDKSENLYSSISAFYYYGIPLFFLLLPIVTFLKPFMPMALMLTLFITGIACSLLANKIATQTKDKILAIIVAVIIAFIDPFIGIAVALFPSLIYSRFKHYLNMNKK